jgi:putative endonuclease
MKKGYTYILASNRNGTLYVGVTSDLEKRIYQHKNGIIDGFTKKHNISMLVHYEEFDNVYSAIEREKFIKGKSRKFKLDLIEKNNPDWEDLSSGWFE